MYPEHNHDFMFQVHIINTTSIN